MAKLTVDQIRAAAAGAGFTGGDLNVAVAVALAESGGNPNAHNSTPPDNSYGLWQINMLGGMGANRRKRFKLSKNEDLFDPATNARVAYGIWKEQGWKRGWTTYSNGRYQRFMGDVGEGKVPNPGQNPEPTTPPAPTTSEGGLITGGFNALTDALFKSAANMGGVAVALVLIVAAIIILVMQSSFGKKIIKKGAKKVL